MDADDLLKQGLEDPSFLDQLKGWVGMGPKMPKPNPLRQYIDPAPRRNPRPAPPMTPSQGVRAGLDPLNSSELQAWQEQNFPKFPVKPGEYGPQLAQDIQQEFVPDPTGTEDQTQYKVARALMMMGGTSPGGSAASLAAVKGKGGMWHPAAVERLAEPLGEKMATRSREHLANIRQDQPIKYSAETLADVAKDEAAFNWADKAIKNYLNKHAGTAEDPLKDLFVPSTQRPDLGGIARWEDLTDKAIGGKPARMYEDLPKTPPEETVWGMFEPQGWQGTGGAAARDIHSYLAHTGDYMREFVPPDQLNRYDLVRAVKETALKDAQRAKEMEKANAEKAFQGVTLHKEYPDKFKWVEVGKTDPNMKLETPKGVSILPNQGGRWQVLDGVNDAVRVTDYASKAEAEAAIQEIAHRKVAQDALNHEGQTMGHCVGSYCDAVADEQTKIYSLRDPKGGSHVTVEVRPADPRLAVNGPQAFLEEQQRLGNREILMRLGRRRDENFIHLDYRVQDSPEYKQWLADRPPSIEQIKGKQNRAPVKEYLPYVQDFVRSGKWNDVGDIQNAGMFRYGKKIMTREEAAPQAIANIQRRIEELKSGKIMPEQRGERGTTSRNLQQLEYNLRTLEAGKENRELNFDSAMHFGMGLYD